MLRDYLSLIPNRESQSNPPNIHAEANTALNSSGPSENTTALETSNISRSQIPEIPFSITSPNISQSQHSPNLTPSKVAKNLTPLFQPSPPSSQLLHLNHPAVLLLPEDIEGKLSKKVKKVLNGLNKNDDKSKELVHRAIIDFTNQHDFTYNHFEKRFDLPFGWH